jgi:maltooligosyltrehalose trehalohydrolase
MLVSDTIAKESRVGATRLPDGGWEFLVWTPSSRSVTLHLVGNADKLMPMAPRPGGYHRLITGDLAAGTRYFYRLDDGRDLPDPASRFQPEGVHGPSQIVDPTLFHWTDDKWSGRSLESSVFYELHIGTYTPEGTFDAVISRLPELVELGVTTIEIMPVAQFPGTRNWGYDGVYLYAPQNSYGGPPGLQRLVNAAHKHGLAVALDVVYNHLGPEGNYLGSYGPYFTHRYQTPWGQAINYDDAGSDEVRKFFIENAVYWLRDYHLDALRLDAVHGIFDFGAYHLLAEMKAAVADLSRSVGRPLHLIAESDLNDARVLHAPEQGGYGLDAQWSDDFHHSVHTLLTGESLGYYSDFTGVAPLAATLRDGWYYAGQHSRHRNRRHGNSPRGISSSHFVVCNQNHDQVGNRAAGARLNSLVDGESMKLAAGITLLSPFVPMLFMGEEYGETAPFQYFTSHGDPALVEAVRKGRRDEFAAFGWQDDVPDPQDERTFARSRLDHSLKAKEPHTTLWRFYQRLIQIREEYTLGSAAEVDVRELTEAALMVRRENGTRQLALIFNFADIPVVLSLSNLAGNWTTVIYSADPKWNGCDSKFESKVSISESGDLPLPRRSFLAIERAQSKEAV